MSFLNDSKHVADDEFSENDDDKHIDDDISNDEETTTSGKLDEWNQDDEAANKSRKRINFPKHHCFKCKKKQNFY